MKSVPKASTLSWNTGLLICISAVGILNIFYYLIMTRRTSEIKETCTIHKFIDALIKFTADMGRLDFSHVLPEDCVGKSNKDIDELVRSTISQISRECQVQQAKKLNTLPNDSDNAVLTLFTSWVNEPVKYNVHNNTVINWNTLMPRTSLVLFTNDSELTKYVEDRGWTVFPVTSQAACGAPVLKHMFQVVMEKFNSTFYGFANSDILFESSLLETLLTIKSTFDSESSVFISGKRANIAFVNSKEAASYGNIRKALRTRGEMFYPYAEDYFITNQLFNWLDVPEVVIGRRAYDNYIVSYARSIGSVTLDVSRTLLAVHQTTESGNFEGHSHCDPDYNDKLLFKLNKPRSYEKGLTTCMGYETYKSLCDVIEITKRKSLPNHC